MDGRRTLELGELRELPVVPARPRGRSGSGIRPRLPRRWGMFATLVGPVVAAFCIAVEPPPADPDAPDSLAATLLGLALLGTWFGAAVTGIKRRPQALVWASMVGVLSIAMTVGCVVSAHHSSVGAWWAGQMIVSGAAFAIAVRGLAQVRSTPAGL